MLIILHFIIIALFFPVFFLGFEILAAYIYSKKKERKKRGGSFKIPSFKILIPAHNEERDIERTLKNLIDSEILPSKILVVADNCTDQTAHIAAQHGVAVVERYDEDLRGKGYALDFGIKSLQSNEEPEILVILDADCFVEKGGVNTLVHYAKESGRPIQARCLCNASEEAGVQSRIAAFAMLLKNYIRPLGLKLINRPCLLFGTGMAFPWDLVKKLNFATGNIVEDTKLGIDCVCLGYSPKYCENVLVESNFPDGKGAEKIQRTRWEHGHLKTIFSKVPELLYKALVNRNLDFVFLACEIGILPLSLLVLLQMVAGVGVVFCGIYMGELYLMVLGALPLVILFSIIIFGWAKFGREVLPSKYFLMIPWYIIKKVPLYLRFLYKPEKKWKRTSRD